MWSNHKSLLNIIKPLHQIKQRTRCQTSFVASRLNNRVLATPEAQLRARPDVSQGELIRVTDSTGVGFPAPKKWMNW